MRNAGIVATFLRERKGRWYCDGCTFAHDRSDSRIAHCGSASYAVLSLRRCWRVNQDFPASVRLFAPHGDVLGLYYLWLSSLAICRHLILADVVGEVPGAGYFNLRWRERQREARSR